MLRVLTFLFSIGLAVGIGEAVFHLVRDMARAAAHAHQHEQLSYAKFTQAMTSATPRPTPKTR